MRVTAYNAGNPECCEEYTPQRQQGQGSNEERQFLLMGVENAGSAAGLAQRDDPRQLRLNSSLSSTQKTGECP